MSRPERIGILGGSFDPVHIGHLALARAAQRARGLDRVLFMPAAVQPLKRGGPRAPDAERLEMLRLAIARDPRFEISTIELDRGGVSYLYDTLVELRCRHPAAELFFITGMDALNTLHAWRRVDEILRLATFIIAARPGFPLPTPGQIRLPEPWPRRLLENVVPCPALDISSSAVRENVAQNRPLRYLVPRAVAARIHGRGLYAPQEKS